MLATHEDACLVGRQKGWPDGMFSSLAGFMNPAKPSKRPSPAKCRKKPASRLTVCAISAPNLAVSRVNDDRVFAEAAGRDITLDDEELEEGAGLAAKTCAAMNGDGPIGVPPWRLRIN